MNNIQYQSGAISPGDCIGSAWTLVTQKFGLYIGVGLVTLILIGCIPFVGSLLLGPVLGGFYYLVLRDMRGEPVDFGMMFKGFEKFLPLMLAGLIQTAPSLIATILQYTVDFARFAGIGPRGGDVNFYQSGNDALFAGISMGLLVVVIVLSLLGAVWSVALSFAVPLILEHDLGVVDALLTSAKAAFSNVGGLIVLIILEALVGILGVMALCFGIFVAVPVIYAANVFAYRMVFPNFERPNINTAPPPPETYGNFGQGI
ncbi:MAG TPA: hypothetical protein VMZ26_07360 [Pyrinomonadaceae bacterium]|nr:hypothetical protein [Pyrinomonadaceae bacterium]